MKKLLQKILYGVFGFVAGLLLIWLGAHFLTCNSQWARAIAWLDSDVDDYKKFPMRTIPSAAPPFYFQAASSAMQLRSTAVFTYLTYPSNGQASPQDLSEFLERTDATALLVIKNEVLLYEGYFNGYEHNSIVTHFSIAKSFVSALVGIAISEGYISSVEDSITKYVPELLEKDPRYQNIHLRHLLTMWSGIRYKEYGIPWSDDTATYYSPNLREVAISSAIVGEPGRVFHYNNFHPLLLGLTLERTTGSLVSRYLADKIWKPLQVK